jgi:hypothetical protein
MNFSFIICLFWFHYFIVGGEAAINKHCNVVLNIFSTNSRTIQYTKIWHICTTTFTVWPLNSNVAANGWSYFHFKCPTPNLSTMLSPIIQLQLHLTRLFGIKNSDAGELPRRKHTISTTRRKFEINKIVFPIRVKGQSSKDSVRKGCQPYCYNYTLHITPSNHRMDWSGWLTRRFSDNSYEYGTELSNAIKDREFLHWLKCY